jgi:hypothetical protein
VKSTEYLGNRGLADLREALPPSAPHATPYASYRSYSWEGPASVEDKSERISQPWAKKMRAGWSDWLVML